MVESSDSEELVTLVHQKDKEIAELETVLADLLSASQQLLALPTHLQDGPALAQRGIEVLVKLVRAQYGAVGLVNDNNELTHFLYTGISVEKSKAIPYLPSGKGLLGAVLDQDRAFRLDDIQQDPRSSGFPPHHPHMTTLLAVPIKYADKTYGRIYLSDKSNHERFNETDEQLISTFADTLGLVLRDSEARIQQRKTEEELRLAAKVIENTLEGVVITDHAFVIQSTNPAFCKISGYQEHEVIGHPISQFQCIERSPDIFKRIQASLEREGHWQGEMWCVKKSGEIYPKSATISAIKSKDASNTSYVIVCRDITKQKNLESQLNHLAHHDALTGLPNRLLFEDRLAQKLVHANRNQYPLSLIFIDLDLFKIVNDSLGHDIGDRLLRAVAERLQKCVRESDTVARLGGDEFTVILDNADIKDAGLVADKIRCTLSQPFNIVDHELRITTSIGIAVYPQDGDDTRTLVKNADNAMYHAKDLGNTYSFYTSTMTADSSEKLILEEHLYKALDNREFLLTYQPKLDLNDERIIGAKVLIRWQHPALGLVKPSSFIPLAEQTGIIVSIGEWVLHSACQQCRNWHQYAPHVKLNLTVSISPRQFWDDNLVRVITSALDDAGLAPSYLHLEISHTVHLLRSEELVVQRLKQLKALGVGIIISNINPENTFYDSEQFALDTLKIDRSLAPSSHSKTNNITESLISKAHGMKLRVIAEGVETEAQLAFLKSKQCDEVLGYYFSRPVSAKEFKRLLSS